MLSRFWRISSRRSRGSVAPALLAAAAALTLTTLPCRVRAQTAPPPPPPEAEGGTPAPPTTPTPNTPGTNPNTPAPPPEAGGGTPLPSSSGGQAGGGGRYLLIPDISLNGVFLGHFTTDRRDSGRDRLRLDQAELAVQSFVYPGIKLDTFTVFNGDGGVNVEEAFLTFQNVSVARLPLSAQLGRRKVPFGRVNQQHPHSWLYIVQPYVLTNLVAGESLTGDGAYLSYLLPTGKLFAQLDAGFWSASESPQDFDTNQNPTQAIISSPGAAFNDKFGTTRLWTAAETLGGSLELGGSLAYGRSAPYNALGSAAETTQQVRPETLLSGLDATFRRAGTGAARLLLRGEYLQHHQSGDGVHRTVDGYYLLADQRLDPLTSVAVRYDVSGFPFANGRENGVSLIGTKQLTESTYYRLQYIHGNRPGKTNFDELHFELVFGVGPHTHNLE